MKLHQTKGLLHREGNYQQNKKSIEWEKIFANSMSDEDIKELIQLNIKTLHPQLKNGLDPVCCIAQLRKKQTNKHILED